MHIIHTDKGWISLDTDHLIRLAQLVLGPLTLDQANALIALAR